MEAYGERICDLQRVMYGVANVSEKFIDSNYCRLNCLPTCGVKTASLREHNKHCGWKRVDLGGGPRLPYYLSPTRAAVVQTGGDPDPDPVCSP